MSVEEIVYQAHSMSRDHCPRRVVFPYPGPATTVVRRLPKAVSSRASSAGRSSRKPAVDSSGDISALSHRNAPR